MSDHITVDISSNTTGRGADWRKRLDGLVPQDIEFKRVLIVGCGSVGSFIAAELARSGIRKFTLVDPDVVEWANLTRTIYKHSDVGEKKVNALTTYLQSVFPDIEVSAHAAPIQQLGKGLPALLSEADLIIAAVDEPKANGLIDRYSYALGKTSVFVGLYKGAKGGEIVVTHPDQTPCFHCSTGGVRNVVEGAGLEQVSRNARDYGTNRLLAEVALGSDIHFVCCAAVKVALSLLCHTGSEGRLQKFVAEQLNEGCNFVMLGMEPDYFLFPSTHASAAGQHAFQSIWAKTTCSPECEVCGLPENRENPI